MSLIDTDTGLSFGEGLQYQAAIGGAGLDIDVEPAPPPSGPIVDFSEASNSMYVPVLALSITLILASLPVVLALFAGGPHG
jgi:hypothetical protein